MKFYYAILWEDAGVEGLLDLTSEVSPEAQEQRTFDILAGKDLMPKHASDTFAVWALRTRYNPFRNYEAWAFVSEMTIEQIFTLFNTAPDDIKKLIRSIGADIPSVVKFR